MINITDDEFTEIYNKYYKRVYNFCYYRCVNHHDSEDLTAVIFEHIIAKYHTYESAKSPFEVWMFAIARNIVTDHFRKIKRIPENIPIEHIADFKDPNNAEADTIIIERETNNIIIQTVNELPEKEKNIISLKFAACLSSAEIASALGMTEINVRVKLSRTLKKLNKILSKKGVSLNEK